MIKHYIIRACLLALAINILASGICVASNFPSTGNMSAIILKEGINEIKNFSPNGEDGIILKAWRDNGNAHGYWLYVVMLPKEKPALGWNIIGIEDNSGSIEDSLRDNPHTGEDYIKTVLFANGLLDGARGTFLIIAERDLTHAENLGAPAETIITTYKLVPQEIPVGQTPYIFKKIHEQRTKALFCNSNLALSKTLNLSFSLGEISNKNDGCP